jgi:hypothetical protein
MGYTTEEFEFDSHYGQEILLYRIQTGSWAHPTSYRMDTREFFSAGKAAGV